MITNRYLWAGPRGLVDSESKLSCWISDEQRAVDQFLLWDRVLTDRFRDARCAEADVFSLVSEWTV